VGLADAERGEAGSHAPHLLAQLAVGQYAGCAGVHECRVVGSGALRTQYEIGQGLSRNPDIRMGAIEDHLSAVTSRAPARATRYLYRSSTSSVVKYRSRSPATRDMFSSLRPAALVPVRNRVSNASRE